MDTANNKDETSPVDPVELSAMNELIDEAEAAEPRDEPCDCEKCDPTHPEDHANIPEQAEAEECCGGHCGDHEIVVTPEVLDELHRIAEGTEDEAKAFVEKFKTMQGREELVENIKAILAQSPVVPPEKPVIPPGFFLVHPVVSRPHNADGTTLGRNDPCLCGSGKKYKKCCLNGNEHASHGEECEEKTPEQQE